MSNLAFVPDPIPTNLEVSITATPEGIVTMPSTLRVPNGFDGTITWTLTGGTFLNPGLTFSGENPPSFELANLRTPTTRVRRWGNFLPQNAEHNAEPYSYYYDVHVMVDGVHVMHDPTVENDPPNG
ncbi:MAG: hypothetical protein ACJ74H_18980 [Thermoanaerobaculia bacterium]